MTTLAETPAGARSPGRAILIGLLLLAGGLAIFVFGWPFYAVWPTNGSLVYNAALAGGFGLLALALRASAPLRRYGPLAYALFVAATANLALVAFPFERVVTTQEPYQLLMVEKAVQCLVVAPVVVVLSWLARRDLGWIFLQRGEPRRWLPFGLVSLLVMAVITSAVALLSGQTAAQLLAAAPYVFVFIVANAIMEELWFRAVFLRPYAVELGGAGAVVVTALVFAASHMNVTYIGSGMGFAYGLVVLVVGLAAAWAMRWGDSLWGSVLFHMGVDLAVILPVIQSLGG